VSQIALIHGYVNGLETPFGKNSPDEEFEAFQSWLRSGQACLFRWHGSYKLTFRQALDFFKEGSLVKSKFEFMLN